MLERLLRILVAEGAVSVSGMAARLDISQSLAAIMLEELARQGYLQPLAAGCRQRCAHCPLHTACLSGGPQRVWLLSSKAARWLARRAPAPEHR